MSSRGFPGQPEQREERVRINHQIRLSPVRLVDPEGAQLGIVTVEEARAKAEELGLDLVEVNPNVRPIVCRIMDYGRFKYDKQKNERKSKPAASELKQIKYRPGIDGHDFETKTAKVRQFLEAGNKVRVTVMFRRRDMRRPENGIRILHRVAKDLADVAKAEDMPNDVVGRDLTCTLMPLRQPEKKKDHPEEAEQPHRLRRHERTAAEAEAEASSDAAVAEDVAEDVNADDDEPDDDDDDDAPAGNEADDDG